LLATVSGHGHNARVSPESNGQAAAPRPRVGHIAFLNSLPFLVGLDARPGPPPFELVQGPPSALNRRLLDGELDVSPISSIQYAAFAEQLVLLPGLSISSDGAVASVLLATRLPPEQLEGRLVALDPSSATSHALVKLVLWERYGVRPRFEVRRDSSLAGVDADAALVIGDRALEARNAADGWRLLDLGEEWKGLTGCQMVYAVWAARRDFAARQPGALEQVRQALMRALDDGLAHEDALVARAAALSGHDARFLRDYYRLLRYGLGEPERAGLAEFYRRAVRHGLLEAAPRLAFAAA
jgi:chorismate dehydratase